ncbi:MAG: nitrous oxide reductase accessory protein NosL [Proteobacteria bacterium]|nr:nitrous oxide reductase accessory protein NosL [Pseudomonadota bacterium]
MAALLAACALLAGCDRTEPAAAVPAAAELTGDVAFEATGYYCGMLLADHAGPKGQIHLAQRDKPLWFSSVRDTIAFTRLPEEPRDISAIYVNDMGRARDWEHPEAGTWINASTAWYVIDSDRRGGMGAPEAIPFGERAAADAFRQAHGGKVLRLKEIPDAYVLGPVDLKPASGGASAPDGHADHSPTHSRVPPAPAAPASGAARP